MHDLPTTLPPALQLYLALAAISAASTFAFLVALRVTYRFSDLYRCHVSPFFYWPWNCQLFRVGYYIDKPTRPKIALTMVVQVLCDILVSAACGATILAAALIVTARWMATGKHPLNALP